MIRVVDTTRSPARVIGNLLARAGRGSKDNVDATVIATALAVGGGVILSADPNDLTALGDGTVGVSIEAL